jgi:pimeloyl-ACP methyl ester carboxylesterase
LSSRDLLATLGRWKNTFTCIAPDTPGYGLSEPLGVSHAEMSDFADAVIEFMDALGIERAATYGFHTGAMISVAVASKYPERVIACTANGYVVQIEQERADFVANYLPPLLPQWDGSHLTWLWSRLREQTIFFPWYRKSLEARLNYDVPEADGLHSALLDFLRAGDHYRVGYRAAFTMPSRAAVATLKVPSLITAANTDVLAQDLARLKRVPANVTVKMGGDMNATLDLCAAFINKHKLPKAPPLAATAPLDGRMWSEYLDVPGGQLRILRSRTGKGRPIVVQHDAAGSVDIIEPLARGFVGRRPVIAIDLPGHGESDPLLPRGRITVNTYGKAVLAALKFLGVKEFDFIGTWGGGLVGLELAILAPQSLRRLVMADAMYFSAELLKELRAHYTPDIRPNWHGGYLLEAWHLLRDQGLFWPWFKRRKANIIRKPPFVDPTMVNKRVLELFRSDGNWRRAYQAHFAYPIKRKLKQCRVPMLVVSPFWDPQFEDGERLSRDFPNIPFRKMPDDWTQWGAELAPFLED